MVEAFGIDWSDVRNARKYIGQDLSILKLHALAHLVEARAGGPRRRLVHKAERGGDYMVEAFELDPKY